MNSSGTSYRSFHSNTSSRKMTNSLVKLSITVVFALFITDTVFSFEVTDCSGKDALAKLDKVTISGCATGTADKFCPLVRGTTPSIAVEFEAESAFSKATIEVNGKIAMIPIPFNLNPNDACGNYGFDCPVEANQKRTLNISVPILQQYPTLFVTIQLKMVNEDKHQIVCMQFPAKIVKP